MKSRIVTAGFVGGLLMIVPMAYSASRISNGSYWNSVMSGWFATVMGIMVGVPFALWVSRWQQLSADAAQSKRESDQRAEALRLLSHRIHNELQCNLGLVEQLAELMTQTPSVARVDHWRWINTIVDAFEFESHEDLRRSALVPPEKLIYYGDIDNAYRELRRVFHRAHQSAAAHDFYHGYQGNESAVNWQLSEFRQHIGVAKSTILRVLGAEEEKEVPEGLFTEVPNSGAPADR